MELNYNWSKVNSSANLLSWLHEEDQETRCITANNIQEQDKIFFQISTGRDRHDMSQWFFTICANINTDPQWLGRWGSWPFFCNPMHATRIEVAYWPCASKVKGLKTVYQQHLRYIQTKGLNFNPLELFDKDLIEQIYKWCVEGERIVLPMDVNEHPMDTKFVRWLTAKIPDMSESSHKCWGPTPPYTHVNGTYPINGNYMSPEIEVVNLAMLIFTNSPGGHRSLILDISTRSLLGEFRYKVLVGNSDFLFQFLGPPSEAKFRFRFRFRRFRLDFFEFRC